MTAAVEGVLFSYRADIGEPALSTFGGAADGPAAVGSDALAHGTMAALIRCELFAIAKGAAPSINIAGQQGFALTNVGGARFTPQFKAAPKEVRDLYLAVQNAARRLSKSASASPAASVKSISAQVQTAIATKAAAGGKVGAVPVAIVVAVVVVAVAAIVATAFYATQTKVAEVQVEGKNLRFIHTMDQVVQMRAAGQEPPPEFLAILDVLARNEESMGLWPWVLGGVVALAAAGAGVYFYFGPAKIKSALGYGKARKRPALEEAEA